MSIDKYVPAPDGLDFQGLKKEGLKQLQRLCGQIWTDYNLHDPGVTILEQLCYALTDLLYRTEFSVADYLTKENGQIDFARQALYPAAEIFPSQAITASDYRKIIFDTVVEQVPELENVWVTVTQQQSDAGVALFQVHLRLRTADSQIQEKAIAAVRDCYADNRNLCEDLEHVKVMPNRGYTLHGVVEIDNHRDPVDLLAELYFQCARYIAPGMVYYSFEDTLKQGKSLEQLFSGPLTERGYIEQSELDRQPVSVTIADLIGIITALDGVQFVERLWFVDGEGKQIEIIAYDPEFSFFPILLFQDQAQSDVITLTKQGRIDQVDPEQVRVEFDRLNVEYRALRQTKEDLAVVTPIPQGEFMELAEYYSIQNQFPVVYGVNRFGVPESATPMRKAQARQLKAYLLFFEQLLANFQATLQELGNLFSLDESLRKSCFHQLLDNRHIADVEELYKPELAQDGSDIDAEIGRILKQYDNFIQRRNQFLDYLLALYGEKFKQNSLRRFNYYYAQEQLEYQILNNKIRFLKDIVDISRNRAAAFNYRQETSASNNISGLEKKLLLLLDMPKPCNVPLTRAYEEQLMLIGDQEFQTLVNQTDSEELSDTLLIKGIGVENYLIKQTDDQQAWQLSFRLETSEQSGYQWCYQNEQQALIAAEKLRNAFIQLNIASEGLYLVEHILLRPRDGLKHEGLDVAENFYPFTISIVFTGWTARCRNKEFRKLAEETVVLNCPAHIFPRFHWLNLGRMQQFETLYEQWRRCKRNPRRKNLDTDANARQLIEFLLE